MVHQIASWRRQILLKLKMIRGHWGRTCGRRVNTCSAGSLPVLCLCTIMSPCSGPRCSVICVFDKKMCWIGSKQKQLRKWASGEDLRRRFSSNQRRLDGVHSAVHCQDPAPLHWAQAAQGLACLQKSYTSRAKHAQTCTNLHQLPVDTVLWISNALHESI